MLSGYLNLSEENFKNPPITLLNMDSKELKQKYLDFFRSKGHAIIKSASLIPENDPSVLFTTAGMHPLVPFLMGTPHPLGKRIADVQKCIRTQDIDEVGDETHTTCFEMLGNWSLGDYFKKEAIEWSWEFLTSKQWLGLDPKRLAVTCFEGDKDAPKDEEAASIWLSQGVPKERIAFLPKKDNWWGPAGETGPCGPDTEMFYWKKNNVPAPKTFDPEDKNWVEIWNDVFMQYNRTKEGKFEQLKQKNVDTGLGVERVTMVLQGLEDIYQIETFKPVMDRIRELSKIRNPDGGQMRSMRIITDHIRGATFILGDDKGIVPSNVDQGYIIRRFIRRAIRHGLLLGIDYEFLTQLAEIIIDLYKDDYEELGRNKHFVLSEIEKEDRKFRETLTKGLREFERLAEGKKNICGEDCFLLFQSYGFPMEITKELCEEKKICADEKGFNEEYEKHKELSRVGAEKKFKGGLGDTSEMSIKLHTATHLLNEALRTVVSKDIAQKGSNITPERLRFDFNFDRKLLPEELKKVEDLVNQKIKEAIPVVREEMSVKEAKAKGAQAEFEEKYGEKVSVYTIDTFSCEICMGPHVKNTSELGHFKIVKEESVAAGVRRIKAVLE